MRRLERALLPFGLDATTYVGSLPRSHRNEVAAALSRVASASDPLASLERELGSAVLKSSANLHRLASAGELLVHDLENPVAPRNAPKIEGHLASLGYLPAETWGEVRSNPAQRAEWMDLFGSDEPETDWPVDSRHFQESVAEKIAEVGRNPLPGGLAVRGDNLNVLGTLPEASVKCLYLDPPYNTRQSRFPYRDSQPQEVWLADLGHRLRLARRLMQDDGVVWVQVDHHAPSGLRGLIERTFSGGIQNVVVWAYGGSGRGAKAVSGRLPRNYDMLILASVRDHGFRLNRVTIPFQVPREDASQVGFRHDGKRWFKTAPRGDYTDESIQKLASQNRIYETREGNLRVKYWLREADGMIIDDRLVGDVWTDIPDMMHAPRNEWTGFPTQKPLSLLKRVLDLSCRPNDRVLDFYGGSGTTACAALEQGLTFTTIECGEHFDSILIPRIKRTMARFPGFVQVATSDR